MTDQQNYGIIAKSFLEYPEPIKQKLRSSRVRKLTAEERQLKRQIDAFNASLRSVVAGLSRDDRSIGWLRFIVIITMSLATLAGAGIALISVFGSGEKLAGVLTGGGIFLFGILITAVVNPLQTVERDFVFRRWSDVLVGSFLLQIAGEVGPRQIASIATRTSGLFGQFARVYVAASSKNVNAITKLAALMTPPAAGEDDEPPTTLSITNPGPQKSTKGVALKPALQITATGPGVLTYKFDGLPADLTPDEAKGIVSGTPSTSRAATEVTVTVTSDDTKTGSAIAKFTWEVSEPAAS